MARLPSPLRALLVCPLVLMVVGCASTGPDRWSAPDAPVVMAVDGDDSENEDPTAVVALEGPGTVEGRLQAGDRTGAEGHFEDHYTFNAAPGRRFTVTLESTDFDTVLRIVDPNGSTSTNDDVEEGVTNSRLAVATEAAGTFVIHVTSYESGESGAYRLTLAVDEIRTEAAQGGPYANPAPLTPGTIRGTLTGDDHTLTSGEFGEWFAISGRAGNRLRLELTSDDFDPYLVVIAPGGEHYDNDDRSSDDLGARVDLELPADGRYVVGVTSAAVGETGAWQLVCSLRTTIGGTSTDPDPLTPGTYNGSLADGDPTLTDGEFVDWFRLDVEAGDQVVVDVQSSDFDSWLVLRMPGEDEFRNNDDRAEDDLDARLELTAPASGQALLGVTSASVGETGGYRLMVSITRASTAAGTEDDPVILAGGERSGSLADDDPVLPSGEAADWFAIEGRVGMRMQLDLQSTDFDAYLVVIAPSDRHYDNDDARDGVSDSRVDMTLDEDGRWLVAVTSYAVGERGAYRLVCHIGRGGAATVTARPLLLGQAVAGALKDDDSRLADQRHADHYDVEVTEGTPVRVNLVAVDAGRLDTVLIVRTPDGDELTNDDASPNSHDSLLHFVAPTTGTYRVIATSYEANQTGAYTLCTVQADSPGGATRQAAASAEGVTYWGIFCGITSYDGTASDLEYCREDAEKLAGAFRAAGLMDSSQQTVLVDSECTAENIRRAFERLKTRVDEKDIVVFFYSGHGARTDPGDYPGEVDERNDTLWLYGDTEVSDDELTTWLGALHDDALKIVALDACHSGGFARDVVNTRNRVGFFSSEEDVTSAVADEFRAGGYLSLMFRRAIEGQADLNSDREVTIGELKDYLVASFARYCNAESEDERGAITRQTLVHDRGAVSPDTVFFRTR